MISRLGYWSSGYGGLCLMVYIFEGVDDYLKVLNTKCRSWTAIVIDRSSVLETGLVETGASVEDSPDPARPAIPVKTID